MRRATLKRTRQMARLRVVRRPLFTAIPISAARRALPGNRRDQRCLVGQQSPDLGIGASPRSVFPGAGTAIAQDGGSVHPDRRRCGHCTRWACSPVPGHSSAASPTGSRIFESLLPGRSTAHNARTRRISPPSIGPELPAWLEGRWPRRLVRRGVEQALVPARSTPYSGGI